jgi:hypothetical protein
MAKITDVGSVKQKLRTFISVQAAGYTPEYAAPEVLNRRRPDPKQDEKVDVYSWAGAYTRPLCSST